MRGGGKKRKVQLQKLFRRQHGLCDAIVKVARAILAATEDEVHVTAELAALAHDCKAHLDFGECSFCVKEDAVKESRAAIAAVLDALAMPSEAMISAALENVATARAVAPPMTVPVITVAEHWSVMVAAARKEMLG